VVKIEKLSEGRIKVSQPYLIYQILKVLRFNERTKVKGPPAMANKILHPDAEGEEMDKDWQY